MNYYFKRDKENAGFMVFNRKNKYVADVANSFLYEKPNGKKVSYKIVNILIAKLLDKHELNA